MTVYRPNGIERMDIGMGWANSTAYTDQEINNITDPEGENTIKEIVAIPSPFARIDTLKTAFRRVFEMERNREVGISKYHQLVSETLDVAEIFFNYDRYRDFFEIMVWHRNNDNLNMVNIFARTLSLYLKADATPYNFEQLNNIYLLRYKGPGSGDLDIIGATSPATLFFPSANSKSNVSERVTFDANRHPFDSKYHSLQSRGKEFKKCMFAFRNSFPEFATYFPEVNSYMDIMFNNEDEDTRKELRQAQVREDGILRFEYNGQANLFLEVLGKPFPKRNGDDIQSQCAMSQFVIKSDNAIQGPKPLVLPVRLDNRYASWRYIDNVWGDNKAPFRDPLDLNERRLPVVNYQYPYLTISDFLADTIVEVPFALNPNSFFDGFQNDKKRECSFLLPLTPTFFKYFTVQQLQGNVQEGLRYARMIEISEKENTITVILRIPVCWKENEIEHTNYVEYERNYHRPDYKKGHNASEPNTNLNYGGVIKKEFGLGVMPLLRLPDNVEKHYRIAFFDRDNPDFLFNYDALLNFYDKNKRIMVEKGDGGTMVVREEKKGRSCSHVAFELNVNFDRIGVKVGDVEGYVIPKFKEYKGGQDSYWFAVDLGTTNTHIEYKINDEQPSKAFDIKEEERQMHVMHDYTSQDILQGFSEDFIPETIAYDKTDYSFPMRTVFAEKKDMEQGREPRALLDGNIPFYYEKKYLPSRSKGVTNLKWSGHHEPILNAYIDNLFLLMRNKVLINNGNLSATKVVWFYPASMGEGRIEAYSRIWEEKYKRYFGVKNNQNNQGDNRAPQYDGNVFSISESKAPSLYFIGEADAHNNIVTIDIGGGTTDVFVAQNQKDCLLLSFRFAANTIFGNGYSNKPMENGFVIKYWENFQNNLKKNGVTEGILQQVGSYEEASDIVSYLFSVGPAFEGNYNLNLLQQLKEDSKMKYVFIFFFGAIFYYIAESMNMSKLNMPVTIAFSGNGSRTLQILFESPSKVAKFAQLIFNKVYGKDDSVIKVRMEEDPKIVTCKGGLAQKPVPQPYKDIQEIMKVYAGDSFKEYFILKYGDVNDYVKNSVVTSVVNFFNLIFELHKDNNEFLITELYADRDYYKKVHNYCLGKECRQTLEYSLSRGLAGRDIDENCIDQRLDETLFFYPLVRFIHDLANKIATKYFEIEEVK